jgi:hypothetical protein
MILDSIEVSFTVIYFKDLFTDWYRSVHTIFI